MCPSQAVDWGPLSSEALLTQGMPVGPWGARPGLKYLLMVFLFVFFFWDSYESNVGGLSLSQRSLRLSSFLLTFFSLSASFISTILFST